MTCVNYEMLMDEIRKMESPIDKDVLIRIIKNCRVDPYEDIILEAIARKKK